MTATRRAAWTAAIILLLPVAQAWPQEIGQPGRGLASAQHLCSECHAVRKEQKESPNPDAPRFEALAKTPGMTSIALSAALTTPHHSMPSIMLDAEERADILAYILGLR